MKEKICVSGIGMVGPFGTGKDAFWRGVVAGTDFLRAVTRYDYRRLAGEVRDFSIVHYLKGPRAMRLPLITQYALAATAEALQDAALDINKCDRGNIAMVYGTGNGSSEAVARMCQALFTTGPKSMEPLLFQESVFNAPASFISIHFGLKGPCATVPMGLTAGHHALGIARDFLMRPEIRLALVISSDQIDKSIHEGLSHLKVLSSNGSREEGMRPFDRTRNGLVFSEGAVALVLERTVDAAGRGAASYGEIAGHAVSHDAYRVADNSPDGAGMTRAMQRALADADVPADAVDYVVAASHSSRRNDVMEARAVRSAFPDRWQSIPVSSVKSSIGETFGPSGLFNVVTGLFALRDGTIPPTIHYRDPDPECDLDVVPNQARHADVSCALCNSFAWSGMYASTVVRRPEGGSP